MKAFMRENAIINDKFFKKLIASVNAEIEVVKLHNDKYYAKVKFKDEEDTKVLNNFISRSERTVLYNAGFFINNYLYEKGKLSVEGKLFYDDRMREMYDCKICYN